MNPQSANEARGQEYIECVAIARTWFNTVAPHRRLMTSRDNFQWYQETQRVGSKLLFLKGLAYLTTAGKCRALKQAMIEVGYSFTRDRDLLNLRSLVAVVYMLEGNTRRMDNYRARMIASMEGTDISAMGIRSDLRVDTQDSQV